MTPESIDPMPSMFQPTLPLRGATLISLEDITYLLGVSTHAPLAGSDVLFFDGPAPYMAFQPTLPLRGATASLRWALVARAVSTHAPLAGSDDTQERIDADAQFQPTLPLRGATGSVVWSCVCDCGFQPTLPLRGATIMSTIDKDVAMFQPTLPLRGATV